jgi:hypothetical protein
MEKSKNNIEREYFMDYCDCVLDYIEDDILNDALYDVIGKRLEDLVFEMYLFNTPCGKATHIVETMLKLFRRELNNFN